MIQYVELPPITQAFILGLISLSLLIGYLAYKLEKENTPPE